MTPRALLGSLGLALAGIASTPALAAARPPGPGGDDRMASALFAGIGDPMCTIAGLLVLAVVAIGLWSRERSWRLGALVLGALSIGLGLGLARAIGGHTTATVIGLVAGIIGVLVPTLQADPRLEPAGR